MILADDPVECFYLLPMLSFFAKQVDAPGTDSVDN